MTKQTQRTGKVSTRLSRCELHKVNQTNPSLPPLLSHIVNQTNPSLPPLLSHIVYGTLQSGNGMMSGGSQWITTQQSNKQQRVHLLHMQERYIPC